MDNIREHRARVIISAYLMPYDMDQVKTFALHGKEVKAKNYLYSRLRDRTAFSWNTLEDIISLLTEDNKLDKNGNPERMSGIERIGLGRSLDVKGGKPNPNPDLDSIQREIVSLGRSIGEIGSISTPEDNQNREKVRQHLEALGVLAAAAIDSITDLEIEIRKSQIS